jgi:nuclear RNA export factor
MAEDEILKKYKIPPPDSPSALKMIGPVILKLASQLQPPCLTLSLANNNFTHTASLSYIQHYLPHLANMSLENNQIRTMRDLDGLTSNKSSKSSVSEIKELVLKGNPICQLAAARGDLEKYRR